MWATDHKWRSTWWTIPTGWMHIRIRHLRIAAMPCHAVPYGTDLLRIPSPDTSCQATIVKSLRDDSSDTLKMPKPRGHAGA